MANKLQIKRIGGTKNGKAWTAITVEAVIDNVTYKSQSPIFPQHNGGEVVDFDEINGVKC